MAFDFGTVASLLSAVGVGSLASGWLLAGRDRRSARAAVLHALGEVETERWANLRGTDYDNYAVFKRACRKLEAEALIARIPREFPGAYIWLATAAAMESIESIEEDPEAWHAGSIDGDFAEIVADAARLVSDIIWCPAWQRRLRGFGRRRTTLEQQALASTNGGILRRLESARGSVYLSPRTGPTPR